MRTRQTVACTWIAAALLANAAGGETVWWTGESSTDWHVDSNWTNAVGAAALPGPGTNVIIDVVHGGATTNHPALDLSGGAVTVASLTIGENTASTLTFSHANATDKNLTVTGNAAVGPNGTLTHTANSTTALGDQHRLFLDVGGDLTVEGAIDAGSKGYNAANGPAAGLAVARAGAGHGGMGGYRPVSSGGTPGNTYGSVTNPVTGGCGGSGTSGGRGGGIVLLRVGGELILSGAISADGGDVASGLAGAGAGGTVNIVANRLSGGGTISVQGGGTSGIGDRNGGGGGGRIAIHLHADTAAAIDGLTIQAMGGPGSNTESRYGGAGTLYVRGVGDTHGRLIVDNKGRISNSPVSTRIWPPVSDADAFGDVLIANSAVFRITNSVTPLQVYGSWSNRASFVADAGSTVAFAGDATATLYGDTTFDRFVCEEPGKTLRIEAGSMQTVMDELVMIGADENLLTLESTDPVTPVQWKIIAPQADYVDVQYVHVTDSDASGGQLILGKDSTDGGNNDNWEFGGPLTVTWTGGASNSVWTANDNWDIGRLPLPNDSAIVIGAATHQPVLDATRGFEGVLVIQSGATLSLNGHSLAIGGAVTNAGTLTASGSETLAFQSDVDFSGGVFNAAQSTLRLVGGTTPRLFMTGDNSFHALDITKGITFTGGLTADRLQASLDQAATLTFDAGARYTVHGLLLRGTPEGPLGLTSSAEWYLDVTGYALASDLAVAYSDASGGKTIYAANSTNNGNNDNWNFSAAKLWAGAGAAWVDADHWRPAGIPGAGTHVLIDGTADAVPELTDATVIDGLTIAGWLGATATLYAAMPVVTDAWLKVNDAVMIGRNGILTHKANSTTAAGETWRLALDVVGDVMVSPGGTIDVSSKGFDPGNGHATGLGSGRAGAGHGGNGGFSLSATGGKTYGAVVDPMLSGTGGAGGANAGRGGGVARLVVGGELIVNGSIAADGGDVLVSSLTGGGAAGSINIQTGTISGSGGISAVGGNSPWGDRNTGAGGGRIAIRLTSGHAASFDAFAIEVMGGYGSPVSSSRLMDGAAGTIYLKGADEAFGRVIVDNAGRYTEVRALTGLPPVQTTAADIQALAEVAFVFRNKAHVQITASAQARSLTRATVGEKLDLGEAGTLLTLMGNMTLDDVVYAKGGLYSLANDWNGFGVPDNISGDGAIELWRLVGSVFMLR